MDSTTGSPFSISSLTSLDSPTLPGSSTSPGPSSTSGTFIGKENSNRVRNYISTGAFTRQSLPYPMPRGSSLEAEVEKIFVAWQETRKDKTVLKSPISYDLLLERSKGEPGLMPEIAEYEKAIKSFTWCPSSLGTLEIKDKRGHHLGYRFKIPQNLLETLKESDSMLPVKAARKQGGGGQVEARGVYDNRHYAVWADYSKKIRQSKEMEKDEPAAGNWVATNNDLFKAMTHELRMIAPEQYVRLTGNIGKFMKRFTNKTGETLKPVAGAWHDVCINRGQNGDVSSSHQDWIDLPSSYNAVAPYRDGFTGGDLILWQLKMRIQLSIGQGFFQGAA